MSASIHSDFSDESDALQADINVTPLVDVTLVILIVFMITVPAIMASAPIKVNLPKSSSVELATEIIPLTVSLTYSDAGELRVHLNERETTVAELGTLIKNLGALADDQPVTLAADRTIPHGSVVQVMDILHGVGLKKIAIDTQHALEP